MDHVKIAIVGAGSYTFGPSMLTQLYMQQRLNDVHLALVDVQPEALTLMAGVGQRMALHSGVRTRISIHTSRQEAFDGADFVICSAVRQGQRRFEMDCQAIARHIPGHFITEFGGIAGLSYSLRQIALVEEIVADMKRFCPRAWLLSVSNPLPRVCQAAQESGIQTVGFCSASLSGRAALLRILLNRAENYPWPQAQQQWDITMAGLNHFSWIVQLRDRDSGADLMGELRDRLLHGVSAGNPVCEQIARESGYLLAPGDAHVRDFLPPREGLAPAHSIFHGDAGERRQRGQMLADVAEGRIPVTVLAESMAWERPIDLIVAMTGGPEAEFHALNLVNNGQIPQLPAGVFVEVPCRGTAKGPQPQRVSLPGTILPYCRSAATVTETIVQAARQRRRDWVHKVVELDPTVLDKPAGIRAIDECLAVHADVLPAYAG